MPARCLIVAPHPDDETIGAAAWMARHRNFDITLLHITDGSPRDVSAAREKGFTSRKAYAAARRRELRHALAVLGPGKRRFRVFSYVDKESYLHMREIISRLTVLIAKLRPEVVLSPPYEGGHPDHDSAALAVAASRRQGSHPFQHREYPLYHASPDGEMISGAFLPDPDVNVEVNRLTGAERKMKSSMMACFKSQQDILSRFRIEEERFRLAPSYDFTRPPHSGSLLYERWNLGISGKKWRHYAAQI